jgi:hypothetical protein
LSLWAKEEGWDNIEDFINTVIEAGLETETEEKEQEKKIKK